MLTEVSCAQRVVVLGDVMRADSWCSERVHLTGELMCEKCSTSRTTGEAMRAQT